MTARSLFCFHRFVASNGLTTLFSYERSELENKKSRGARHDSAELIAPNGLTRCDSAESKNPTHKPLIVGSSGAHMVVDEDVLVLCFMQRPLTPSLDRLFTRFLVFRELSGVYVWVFLILRDHIASHGIPCFLIRFTYKKTMSQVLWARCTLRNRVASHGTSCFSNSFHS